MTQNIREMMGSAVVAGLVISAISAVGFALSGLIVETFSIEAPRSATPGGNELLATAAIDQRGEAPGRLQYRQLCARCHGVQGQGRSGPTLVNTWLTRDDIEPTVREGIPPFMPAFGNRLRTDQIRAISDYVLSLSGGSAAPSSQIAAQGSTMQFQNGQSAEFQRVGDSQVATSGRFVFRRQCAGCHGIQAQGRGTAPPLANAGLSREEVEAAVHEGIPPLMPAFVGRLRPDQIQAVADYVASLNSGSTLGTVFAGNSGWGSGLRPSTSRGRMSGMGCPMMR